jgi:hypothetical protein
MQMHSNRLQLIHFVKIRYAFSCHEFPFRFYNFIYNNKQHCTTELN